jgi:hypothetical protein
MPKIYLDEMLDAEKTANQCKGGLNYENLIV